MSPQTVHQFAEKVALVSDAASPVGRAVAMQLALQGSYVIGLFPNAKGDRDASVNELVELGTLAHGYPVDPSTKRGAKDAAEEVGRTFGRLDLLVNCLKPNNKSSFESANDSGSSELLGRAAGAAYFLTEAVFDLMDGRPKPKIVNVAFAAEPGSDPLSEASHGALAGMTSSFAARLPKKYRVNCVSVKEAVNRSIEGDLFRPASAVAPDDVARAVLFLLSSESIGMNGQILKLG